MDTVPLPSNGWVRLRMRLDDFVGGYMFHCHFIDHEDLGMMMNVVIVDDTQSNRLSTEDVNAFMAADLGADASLDNKLYYNPAYDSFYTSDNFGQASSYQPQCSFPSATQVPD